MSKHDLINMMNVKYGDHKRTLSVLSVAYQIAQLMYESSRDERYRDSMEEIRSMIQMIDDMGLFFFFLLI